MNKILFLTLNGEWGGSEVLWYGSAKESLKRGYLVGVMTYNYQLSDKKMAELQKYPNIKFFEKRKIRFLQRITNKFLPKKYKLNPVSNIIKWKPDLVLISRGCNQGGEDIMLLLLNNSIKYCIVNQSVLEHMWPSTQETSIIRNGFEHAFANYFVSKANLRLTEYQMGVHIPRSKVIRNPFNVPYHANLAYPNDTTLHLACVARYHFISKGHDVLFEVLSQKKWRDRNIVVNLYGSGSHETGIRKLIDFFDLKNVKIQGFCSVIGIWENNHALILPSRHEGLPIVIIEAMLCGRLAIVTNVSGNTEVIIDNENGFVAESPNAMYLDAAMERAWSRKSEWKAIGQQAQKYIKTLVPEFPVTVFLDDMLQ